MGAACGQCRCAQRRYGRLAPLPVRRQIARLRSARERTVAVVWLPAERPLERWQQAAAQVPEQQQQATAKLPERGSG